MKSLFLVMFASILGLTAAAQSEKKTADEKTPQVVEASCGQCQFGMKSKSGCDLAVRINGTAYFVTGTKIDQHGDAHADDGFCNAIRKAKVTGKVEDNKFVATSFKLLPEEKAKP